MNIFQCKRKEVKSFSSILIFTLESFTHESERRTRVPLDGWPSD